ncbi:MAG: 50S ribosomal protein L19 [Rickettsiales bacterium]|nr:50S ribosomal protein L19 [Rickettsiales bacterium]
MKNYIKDFDKSQIEKLNKDRGFKIPKFKAGDTVSVKYKIVEGANSRIQAFNGVVIARSKDESNYCATFTVRKISGGIGVERKFTLYSPLIAGIEVLKRGVVRRSKLYYLRDLTGKASRIKEKLQFDNKAEVKEEFKDSLAEKTAEKKELSAVKSEDKIEEKVTETAEPKAEENK